MSEMQMMVKRSATIGKLAAALAKAQRAIKQPIKDKTGVIKGKTKDGEPYQYTYKYADLSSLIDSIRGPFAENGLAVSQVPVFDGGALTLATLIAHESDEWMEGSYPIALGSAQEMGSRLSYARRYSLGAMAGVAADDDDDGGEADRNSTKPKPQPARKPEPKPAPATLPLLSDEEQQKLANWEASLETHHSPEQLAVARDKAGAIRSAVLKAAVMAVIERWAKAA